MYKCNTKVIYENNLTKLKLAIKIVAKDIEIKCSFFRTLTKEDVVILDSLNYIKGKAVVKTSLVKGSVACKPG